VDEVRREIKDSQLVKEAFDPYGIEGFGHVQVHRTREPLFAKVAIGPSDPKLHPTSHAYQLCQLSNNRPAE
jgi:hypothetical protein